MADSPSHAWLVDRYPRFEGSYEKLTKKDARLKAALDKMMDRVEEDPLIGNPKTGQLRGLRQIHVLDHWVLTWELRPVIVSRKFQNDLREVWFYEIEHHPE